MENFNPIKGRNKMEEDFRKMFGRYPSMNELLQFEHNIMKVFGVPEDIQRKRDRRKAGI